MSPIKTAKQAAQLDFYADLEDLETRIVGAIEQGAQRFLFFPRTGVSSTLVQRLALRNADVVLDLLDEPEIKRLPGMIGQYDAVVLLESQDPDRLSEHLLRCLEMNAGLLLAPVTANHISRRGLFIMTIPKSGTHMLIKLLELAGIPRNFDALPKPGHWGVIDNYTYHAPCHDFLNTDWTEVIGRHPFFYTPAIFTYRHPLDIVASELSWYQRDGHAAFSHYLRTLKDSDERLMRLIEDPFVLGSIRDRVNRYVGWLDFSNVIAVSYEELVGEHGGGDRTQQEKTIWSLQLKLHIPGSPRRLADGLYDRKSATFDKGVIGRYKDVFKPHHYKKLRSLPQDFIEKLGYDINEPGIPKFVDRFRKQPLTVWRPSENERWSQRLIVESYFGYNVVSAGGQYVVISQEIGAVDLSVEENRNQEGVKGGFATLEDAKHYVILTHGQKNNGAAAAVVLPPAEPHLVEESYNGFNILSYADKFYAMSQATGPMDIASVDLDALQRQHQCIVGSTLPEARRLVDEFNFRQEFGRGIESLRQQQAPGQAQERLGRLAQELGEREGTIARLNGELAARDKEVAKLKGELESRESSIAKTREDLRAREDAISKLNAEMGSRDSTISKLNSELGIRDTTISKLDSELGARDAMIAKLDWELGARDNTIAQLNDDLAVRDKELLGLKEDLNERDQALSDSGRKLLELRATWWVRLGTRLGILTCK